jgi:aminoglycoside phosphotransferase
MEDWEPVTLGRSGDGVWHSPDASAYAKQGDVGGECDRLLWLASIGFPAPRVLDFEVSSSTLLSPRRLEVYRLLDEFF